MSRPQTKGLDATGGEYIVYPGGMTTYYKKHEGRTEWIFTHNINGRAKFKSSIREGVKYEEVPTPDEGQR